MLKVSSQLYSLSEGIFFPPLVMPVPIIPYLFLHFSSFFFSAKYWPKTFLMLFLPTNTPVFTCLSYYWRLIETFSISGCGLTQPSFVNLLFHFKYRLFTSFTVSGRVACICYLFIAFDTYIFSDISLTAFFMWMCGHTSIHENIFRITINSQVTFACIAFVKINLPAKFYEFAEFEHENWWWATIN